MGQRQSYTKEFKDAIRVKVLGRGNRSVAEICEQEGLKVGTVTNWLKPHGSAAGMKKTQSTKWLPEQKLKAINETFSLSELELGAYLRKHGIFGSQLEEWRKAILDSMTTNRKPKHGKDDRDQQIKTLEKEILRKDRALAEASALLILQKKVNLIWGHPAEDEK